MAGWGSIVTAEKGKIDGRMDDTEEGFKGVNVMMAVLIEYTETRKRRPEISRNRRWTGGGKTSRLRFATMPLVIYPQPDRQ